MMTFDKMLSYIIRKRGIQFLRKHYSNDREYIKLLHDIKILRSSELIHKHYFATRLISEKYIQTKYVQINDLGKSNDV